MKHLPRYLLLPVIIFSLFACNQQAEKWHATNIADLMPDLAFSLTDQNNIPVTADNYHGKITILFFGYTNCPDVCPLTLGKLSAVLHGFPKNKRKHFQVLFVSVDPARDNAAVRKQYCAAFGPEFYGLSGTMTELRNLNRRYRVTFGYGKPDKKGHYIVSHSSAIYIFDTRGKIRLLARGTESNQALAEDLQQLLKNRGQNTDSTNILDNPNSG